MGRKIYVNGGIVATAGNLYAREVYAGMLCPPEGAEIKTPKEGVLWITNNMGSIFDTYYASGFVSAGGCLSVGLLDSLENPTGSIVAFKNNFDYTLSDFEIGFERIKKMLALPGFGDDLINLHLQQQYASTFSLLESFLSCTFIWQTCNREDSYRRVLESKILHNQTNSENRRVLDGEDGLRKQFLFIELANKIVFHRHKDVASLFSNAFGIEVNLAVLEEELIVRNDISHRFGQTKSNRPLSLKEDDVLSLLGKMRSIVTQTAEQIRALPPVDD